MSVVWRSRHSKCCVEVRDSVVWRSGIVTVVWRSLLVSSVWTLELVIVV